MLYFILVEKGQPNKDSGKRNGVYMSYGLFGGILAAIVIISTAVHIGTCYYYRLYTYNFHGCINPYTS